jgi:hypothetical protein
MDAVSISETSLNFQQTTRRNFPEDSHLHFRRLENLNSHPVMSLGTENRSNRSVRMAGTWPEIGSLSSIHKSDTLLLWWWLLLLLLWWGETVSLWDWASDVRFVNPPVDLWVKTEQRTGENQRTRKILSHGHPPKMSHELTACPMARSPFYGDSNGYNFKRIRNDRSVT